MPEYQEYKLGDGIYKHLIIETYDFAYCVLCKEFEMEIIKSR